MAAFIHSSGQRFWNVCSDTDTSHFPLPTHWEGLDHKALQPSFQKLSLGRAGPGQLVGSEPLW